MPSKTQTQSPPSSAHHRRIELQSTQDMTYLQDLGTKAAHIRLTTAFPPSQQQDDEEDDELRSRVNHLVSEFLDRTYTGVKMNSTAAGVPLLNLSSALATAKTSSSENVNPPVAEAQFEDFDAKTADRIRELERRREKALVRVAALRKEGVGKAAKRWREEWERNREADDVKMEDEEAVGVEKVELVDGEVLRRWEDVQRTHRRGLDGLVGLKSGMGAAVGRLEEARRVGEELEGRR